MLQKKLEVINNAKSKIRGGWNSLLQKLEVIDNAKSKNQRRLGYFLAKQGSQTAAY